MSLRLWGGCCHQSHRSQSPSRPAWETVPRATGRRKPSPDSRAWKAVWMRREPGSKAWGDSRATNPLPLPQAGIQTPITPKPPLLRAAWHSPVRDTLGPFSLWDRLSEVTGEEGSLWAEKRSRTHCTHSCPLRFSEFCSHADSPEGRGLSCWEGPREGSSPQGLRDSGNVGLVPNSQKSLTRPCVPRLRPEANLSGCLVETPGSLGPQLSQSRFRVLTVDYRASTEAGECLNVRDWR